MRVVLFADRGFATLYLLGSLGCSFFFIYVLAFDTFLSVSPLLTHLVFGFFYALYFAALDRFMRRRIDTDLNAEMRYLADGSGVAAGPVDIVAISIHESPVVPRRELSFAKVRFRTGPSFWLRGCVGVCAVAYPWLMLLASTPVLYRAWTLSGPWMKETWYAALGLQSLLLVVVAWRYETLTISLDGIQLGRRTVHWKDVGRVSRRGQWLRVEVRGQRALRARLLSNGGPRQTSDMAREVIEDGPGGFLPRPTLLAEKLWPEPPAYDEHDEERSVANGRRSL